MTLDDGVQGMPTPRTALVGRERELHAARNILEQRDTRLLTLTGVGGCGKTRLAFHLAREHAPNYPQRAWAVEMAAVTDSDLIPIVVADALGLQESSSTSSLAALVSYIADRPALLLLDNCEHLIVACAAFVDTLLDKCPGLRVLATSREPLHIAGEQQYRVPPLGLPAAGAQENVDALAASPAVALFIARAQSVEPAFELTATNAATIARICARLEGIPLALELAAARVRLLGVEQLLARLDDSFQLLTGGSRVAPTRHQTLQAALDWSDALLTEAERAVFRRLAVFAGEFQLDAMEVLCADAIAAPDEPLDVLAGLVDKSLVLVASDDYAAWYRLLEPVRQYALEQLVARGEAAAVRERHAGYYLELAERSGDGLRGPDQEQWLERLEREQGNLRAALEWARQADNVIELQLATALEPFWVMHGHLVEGLRRFRGALERAGEDADRELRMHALAGAGRMSYYFNHTLTSRYVEAEAFSTESLALARALGDDKALATALSDLGTTNRLQEDLERSRARLEEAVAIFNRIGEEHGLANAQLHLGVSIHMTGEPLRGTRLLHESLGRFRALGDQRLAALAEVLLGRAAAIRGERQQAIEFIVNALSTHHRLGDRWFTTWDLFALASVLLDADQLQTSIRFIGAAQAMSDRLGSPVGGVSFQRVLTEAEALRSEDWFDDAWNAGYALERGAAVREARALLEQPLWFDRLDAEPDYAPLTPREIDVARLLAAGHTDREIADALFIAPRTVGTHVHNILQKLELQSRVQVAGWLASREPPAHPA